MSRRGALPVIAILVALALGGCGADKETTGQEETSAATPSTTGPPQQRKARPPAAAGGVEAQLSPDAQVDLAIKGVLASAAPDLACRRYATLAYVKKTFGSRSGCVQSTVPASAAEFVNVSKIKISEDEASAIAVPNGGPSNGERITVKLVRQGGIWKVESLRSNAPVGP